MVRYRDLHDEAPVARIEHPLFGDARMGGVPYWGVTDLGRNRAINAQVGDLFWDGVFMDDPVSYTHLAMTSLPMRYGATPTGSWACVC